MKGKKPAAILFADDAESWVAGPGQAHNIAAREDEGRERYGSASKGVACW